MNPALLDELLRRGVLNVVPVKLCAERRIGADRVGLVLTYLTAHADADGRISYGAKAIADDLGLRHRRVREALDVLCDGGMIARTGRKLGRAIEYVLLVDDWPDPFRPRRHVAGIPAPSGSSDVAGKGAGDVAGKGAGIPAPKGSEGKGSRPARTSECAHGDAGDPTDDDLDKIIEAVGGCDPAHARKVWRDILARAVGEVRDRLAYVLRAIGAEPDRYRPTPTPKRPPECPHGVPAPHHCEDCDNADDEGDNR